MDVKIVKTTTISLIFFFGCTVASIAGTPAILLPFWSGIDQSWLPKSDNEYWRDSDRKKISEYCRNFAAGSSAATLLPAIISDVKVRPSLIRESIYIRLALEWNQKSTLGILRKYYNGKDTVERNIAADFIADIEEGEASAHL